MGLAGTTADALRAVWEIVADAFAGTAQYLTGAERRRYDIYLENDKKAKDYIVQCFKGQTKNDNPQKAIAENIIWLQRENFKSLADPEYHSAMIKNVFDDLCREGLIEESEYPSFKHSAMAGLKEISPYDVMCIKLLHEPPVAQHISPDSPQPTE